jgi:hypothetical protein
MASWGARRTGATEYAVVRGIRKRIWWVAFGLYAGLGPAAWATPIVIPALEDTVVVSSEPNSQTFFLSGSLASRRRIVSGQVDHEIWSFLKFELPDAIPGSQIGSAYFRGTYTGVSNQLTHELSTVTSDAWQESTITWNNMPSLALTRISPFRETNSTLVGQSFELDVTQVANTEYLGDGILTLVMRPSDVNPLPNGIQQIAFGSSNSTIGFEPVLVLTLVPEPSALSLLALGILAWRMVGHRSWIRD